MAPDDPADRITPIMVHGTNISTPEVVYNNTARHSDVPPSPGGGSGGTAGLWKQSVHNIMAIQGRYKQQTHQGASDSTVTYVGPDFRQTSVGGMWDNSTLTMSNDAGPLPTSRGQELTIISSVTVLAGSEYENSFNSCVALDTDNYELVPFDPITQVVVSPTTQPFDLTYPAASSTIVASDGPLAHVISGTSVKGYSTFNSMDSFAESLGVAGSPLDYVVEFGVGAPAGSGVNGHDMAEDAVTCNDADATWIASGAVTPADYPNITRVRVRMTSPVDWSYLADGINPQADMFRPWNAQQSGPAVVLVLQARVKSDLAQQVNGEELFFYSSRGFGAWDAAAGRPSGITTNYYNQPTVEDDCQVDLYGSQESFWEDDGNTLGTTTGWCNEPYVDDDSAGPTHFSLLSMDECNGAYCMNRSWNADKLYIVDARLAIKKENLDGGNDVADNGDLVRFRLSPSVTGATTEALSNIVMTDDLNAWNYDFVGFISQPLTAPPCTESANVVTCQFSEPDPAVDSDPLLPPGRAGGWSDFVDIEVRKVGGVSAIPAAFDPNRVDISSTQFAPWDPATESFTQPLIDRPVTRSATAGSYMPPPAIRSAVIKSVPTQEGPCVLSPEADPPPAGWGDRCSMIDFDGNMAFDLAITNTGNTVLSDIRLVDVFPHLADELETVSNTVINGVPVSTQGDGRTPESVFDGTVGFVSLTGSSGTTTTWVTADDPAGVSRDPERAILATTWCDAVGGTVQNPGNTGSGGCPATANDVTATYAYWSGTLNPGQTYTQRLTLDSQDSACDNIWTNSFGARSAEILLPIRSNDVSIMVNCEFDLALEKTVDPSWTPPADWLTPGASTVDFLIEVTNQGDPVEVFDVTDYVDSSVFTFDVANNSAGITSGSHTYPFTWDVTDPAKPVVSVRGRLLTGESVFIPVTLTVAAGWNGQEMANLAEVSYFDSDGDPTNGDGDPANPNNPSTGPLVDIDSTPDGTNNEPGDGTLEDGEINESVATGDTSGDGVIDEDDHDIAVVPLWDLELIKTARSAVVDTSTTPPTVTFDITVNNQGNRDAYSILVTDYGPNGLTYNAAATAALWASEAVAGVTDAAPGFTIDGPIAPAGSATFPLVFDLTDITATPFRNAAEISSFDDNADPADAANPMAVDVDSTPDTTDSDAVIDHDINNYDPDGDSNLNESTAGDEDDHDIEIVTLPYDLALQKRIDPTDPDLADGVSNGDKLRFFVEVHNQGDPVEDFDVTDYVADSWVFDPADNPSGFTTAGSGGGPVLPYSWGSSDPTAPVVGVDGVLPAGESVLIPVVLTVDLGDPGDASSALVNYAEISRFDNDGDPSNGDSDPANPNNPASGPLLDDDSTPDGVNSDVLIDDRIDIDAAGGDEDDHDIASTLWFDLALIKTNSTPLIDLSAAPVEVEFDITVKNQGPSDVVDVEVTDTPPAGFSFDSLVAPPAGVSSSAADGFDIASLASGASVTFTVRYTVDMTAIDARSVNTAEISAMAANYDPDGPNGPIAPGVHPAADIDSTPDSDPANDPISVGDPANPGSGADIDYPSDSNNFIDFDADGDGNIHRFDGIDEDDHDTETVTAPVDLALAKTLVSVSGSTVEMAITITNQAGPVETIEVTDYLDPAMWSAFDVSLNPDGAAGGTAANAFGFGWDASDPQNPKVSLSPTAAGDPFVFGETLIVPITVTISPSADHSVPVVNVAEISNFDTDGDATNGDAASGALTDLDSTPDATDESTVGETIGGDLVDNLITGDGAAGNDEDDHDPVIIPVMDLALRKTVSSSTSLPVVAGQTVTFDLEVFNQGSVDVTDPTLIDYVDTTMWEAFDPSINPVGTSSGDAALAYAWAASGDNGTVAITGTIPAGDSVVVPVTLTIAAGASLDSLSNVAEITGGIATVDDDGDPTTAPVPVLMPDTGAPLVDIDSTPDSDNTDPLTDDVIDGSNGDEDDHDIALVQAPTYSLGNQVWFDADNDGVLEDGESVIGGVLMELFTDSDGDGAPDDTNGDGRIDSADAVATQTTGANGDYLFTDLASGDYIVGIAPSNWGEDGALYGYLSSDLTEASGNTDLDDLDNGEAGVGGYVWSESVRLDGSEPVDEIGLNNDVNTPDSNSNLTVDFGFWRPNFDLALRKTIKDPKTQYEAGDEITFLIEVFNQGVIDANGVKVIEYLPQGLTLADDDWTVVDGQIVSTVPGTIPAGQSRVVEVTTKVSAGADGKVVNKAEIAEATPLGPDGSILRMPNGVLLPDVDSRADVINDDPLTDDVIDGASGDEDDHDVASIVVAGRVVTAPSRLAYTGSSSQLIVGLAGMLMLLGLLMLGASRRTGLNRRRA